LTHAPQTCLSAYSSTLAKYFYIIHYKSAKVNTFQLFFYFYHYSIFIVSGTD